MLLLIGTWVPIWAFLGDPSLNPRSEARYAWVSLDLAQRGSWLVPYNGDEPHLTKPPLTYWLEAASIKAFGVDEFAVRLPSALAGSLVILLLVGLTDKLHGRRRALIAGALLAVMPLHVVISRLTLTDGLLALWWFATLAFGCLAVREPRRRRWAALLWCAIAMGWLTKGPLILLPLAVLAIWLAVGGRWREIRHLRPWIGLPLSLLPIAAWAIATAFTHAEALDVWRAEILGRASGGGTHPQPFWFFIPVVLVGMFPATAMLNLPWLNHRARVTGRVIRRGRESALWLWAVVLPLVIFSLPAGKLPTYVLPLAPPLALLAAPVIEAWLTRRADARKDWPDVRITLFVVALVLTVGGFIASHVMLGPMWWWVPLPAVAVLIATGWQWWIWQRRPALRSRALAITWLTIVLAWGWGYFAVGVISNRFAAPVLLQRITAETSLAEPVVATFDFEHEALAFYSGRFVWRLNTAAKIRDLADEHGRRLVIVAKPADWQAMAGTHPETAGRFERLFDWPLWPADGERHVYRPR